MMRKVPLVILVIAGLMSVAASWRYLLADEFMPYHAVVAGKTWSQLEPGVQAIIVGMLKIIGGGFLACGVALLWLVIPLNRGAPWARWAVLSVGTAVWLPTQYVTLVLRSTAPNAEPPILPTAIILTLIVLGVGATFFVRTPAERERR